MHQEIRYNNYLKSNKFETIKKLRDQKIDDALEIFWEQLDQKLITPDNFLELIAQLKSE